MQQKENGAGNEVRTRDLNLGKVALYQLSYSRILPILVLRPFASTFGRRSLLLERRQESPKVQHHRPERQDHSERKQEET